MEGVSIFDNLEEALDRLKHLYGNPRPIWTKTKNDFLEICGNPENWGKVYSVQRQRMLSTTCSFLRKAESLAGRFKSLECDIFSSDTVETIVKTLPKEIVERFIRKQVKSKRNSSSSLSSSQILDNIKEIIDDALDTERTASELFEGIQGYE